ncbi:hypothetical protein FRC14_005271 [Serendipita sp. 396]|nr:hypothetical protein FRC14_005271 [Serendipita sp. 396]KAG8802482.1 hypothetical protein FRC16_009486 [Serendipita sp. 398]
MLPSGYSLFFSLIHGCLFSLVTFSSLLFDFIVSSRVVVLSATVLVNGVGMSLSPTVCALGIFLCIFFYVFSKLLVYLILLEKVYIVWPNKGTRWSSKAYRIGSIGILALGVVVTTMIIGRISFIRNDRQCVIGLAPAASLTTLSMDLFVNILLTSLFLWPLWTSKLLSARLRRVASRTLIASVISLTISVANMGVLTYMKGHELGFICLASCSTDVVVNAVALFWLTTPNAASEQVTPLTNNAFKDVEIGPGQVTTTKSGRGQRRVNFTPGQSSGDQQLALSSLSPSVLKDTSNSEDVPQYFIQEALTPVGAGNRQEDRRRHSVGVIVEGPSRPSGGIMERFFGKDRSSKSNTGQASMPSGVGTLSMGAIYGLDGRKRKTDRTKNEEEVNVEITVTTYMDNDDEVRRDFRAT